MHLPERRAVTVLSCHLLHAPAEVATISPALAGLAVLVWLSSAQLLLLLALHSQKDLGVLTAGLSLWIWERKWKNEVAEETLCGMTQDLVMRHTDRKRCGNRELHYKATANQDSVRGVTCF